MWFLKIEDCGDKPDSHGYHEDFCNGKYWIDNQDIKNICCGSKYCYYCRTIMHGCTDNIWESSCMKYHSHCKIKN